MAANPHRKMNKVLVIVVTWNSMRWLDRCLGSLRSSTVPVDVLVVDNASTDGTPDAVAERFPEAELHRMSENLGFGAANNIGLRLALERGYEFVYLLNSDAWLLPDTLEKLLAASSASHAVTSATPARPFGILSPVQMTADLKAMDPRFAAKCARALGTARTADQVGGDLSVIPDSATVTPGSPPVIPGSPPVIPGSDRESPAPVEVPFVMAAHWLISRDALQTVGEFSASFRHYGEDDNYIDRLHYHGFHCGVVPGALAVHDRAQRPETKEWRMQLKCISAVVKLSNPCAWLPWMMIREPLELIGMAIKNFSAAPLRFLPGFIARYPALIRERRATRLPGYRI